MLEGDERLVESGGRTGRREGGRERYERAMVINDTHQYGISMRASRTSVAELWEAKYVRTCARARARTPRVRYVRRIGDSRANQRAFVLRMNGSRCAHGAALTSKIENVIRRISTGRDRDPSRFRGYDLARSLGLELHVG